MALLSGPIGVNVERLTLLVHSSRCGTREAFRMRSFLCVIAPILSRNIPSPKVMVEMRLKCVWWKPRITHHDRMKNFTPGFPTMNLARGCRAECFFRHLVATNTERRGLWNHRTFRCSCTRPRMWWRWSCCCRAMLWSRCRCYGIKKTTRGGGGGAKVIHSYYIILLYERYVMKCLNIIDVICCGQKGVPLSMGQFPLPCYLCGRGHSLGRFREASR